MYACGVNRQSCTQAVEAVCVYMANGGPSQRTPTDYIANGVPSELRTQIALICGSNFMLLQIPSSSVEACCVHLRSKSDPQVPLSSLNLQITG